MITLIYRIYRSVENESLPAASRPSELITNIRELMRVVLWSDQIKIQVRPREIDAEWQEVTWSKRSARFLSPKKFEPTHRLLLRKHIRDLNHAVRLNIVARHVTNCLVPDGLDLEYKDDPKEEAELDSLAEELGNPWISPDDEDPI